MNTKKVQLEVPLLDLSLQYREIENEIMEAFQSVCKSQRFILGKYVQTLEEEIAAYCQCRHGVGVSSGTDALLLALMALEVGHGDEVITSPYTFFATGGVVARLGARPLFCDIDPITYNISPEAVTDVIATQCDYRDDKLINRKTGGHVKAMLPVHLYGQMADMDPLMDLARRYSLKVVEDAAQAIGSEYHSDRRAGSMGDIGCFSFFPSKNLGAFGDAGLCTTNNREIAERLRILRVHGMEPKYYHSLIGGNFRLDELQAAVLLIKLKYLDRWIDRRQENARFYDAAFTKSVIEKNVAPPQALPGNRHIYNQYVLRVERRDALRKYLADAMVGTEVYYPVPLHRQKCFSYLGHHADDFPESNRAAESTLALPIYPELTETQTRYVVNTISEFYS